MKKIMLVFGTRPEAIKMCPLVNELKTRKGIKTVVCVSGQHREMLRQVLETFGVVPDHDLSIMKDKQTLFDITVNILERIKAVLEEVRPDVVLVHGDTSTTFSGALAAFYHQVPVGHVEAGLRTWDKYSPFPEEMNRTLVSDIAALHFCPTENNLRNLEREGVAGDKFITGNTVIDAMKTTVRPDFVFSVPELNALDFSKRRVIAVTCHRRENYGEPMRNIMEAIRELALRHEEIEIVYPVHLSPVVRECAFGILKDLPRVHLIDPIDVENMHNLMARCFFVMTDSGGLQEEAPALGKPVLVLRRETERPEAVKAGTVRLAGVEKAKILALAEELLGDDAAYQRMAHAVNPYGDGNACARIAQAILWHFGRCAEKPADFGV